jgi:hypothetical protein
VADIEGELRTFILTDTDVTDLISSRLYYGRAPQNATKPYVSFSVVNDTDEATNIGNDGSTPRFVFTTVATSMLEALDIDKKIRTKIHRYSGTLTTFNVINITTSARRDIISTEDISAIDRDYIVRYER